MRGLLIPVGCARHTLSGLVMLRVTERLLLESFIARGSAIARPNAGLQLRRAFSIQAEGKNTWEACYRAVSCKTLLCARLNHRFDPSHELSQRHTVSALLH
jgi:hypothetical protein